MDPESFPARGNNSRDLILFEIEVSVIKYPDFIAKSFITNLPTPVPALYVILHCQILQCEVQNTQA